ncbi:MAG: hypothetical protein IPL52_01785 [Flavobacteriales bacterium]|nr:hypothetical protein [Flavobacteriales bacterium]
MHKTILVATLFASVAAFAQPKTDKASVDFGPELNEKETGEFSRVFGQSSEAVFMTMSKKKDVLIQRVDGSLRTQYSKVLDLEMEKKDLELEDLMVIGDRILAFTSLYDKKADKRTMYLRTFGADNMMPEGGWQRVAEFDSEKERQGGFGVELSPNRKHVLVHVQLPYEKEMPEKFQLHVFSADMAPEWDREITLPYDDKLFSFEEFRVDCKGDVVMIGVKYLEKREAKANKRAGKAAYDYHLITYSADGSEQDHAININDKFLQDLTLSLDSSSMGDILCGGFYGEKGTNKVRGCFFLSLDPKTKAVKHQSYKEFSDDFITQYMTAKQEEKARKKAEKKDEELELYEYDLSDIVRRDDGGAVLVGEQYYMYTTQNCYTSQGRTTCYTVYHYLYNSIIVINIDPDGNIAWASQIPKFQHTTNDGGYFSSYAMEVKGDKLYFIYNDNGENLFLNAGDKFKPTDFQGKSSIVTMATVSIDGHVKREAFFDPEKRDLILRPKSARQLDDDRMFIYSTRKKDYRFGMVTFD